MFQYFQGKHNTQGHKAIPEGCFEEEHGRKGFYGQVSHLIKEKPSTRWTHIEGNLRPHLFDCVKLPKDFGSWQRLLHNKDLSVYYYWESKATSISKSFRNADGDLLYFCHQGSGEILTEYGLLSFRRGSYINMPKCVNHTFACSEDSVFLVIESRSGGYREPDRGMVGRNGFYDTAAMKPPSLEALKAHQQKQGSQVKEILVKRLDELTRFSYADDVYDTVGWKGDFFPFTLHVDDLMPITSARVHLPPSVHTTFVANGFVVCSFLPRPIESDADALKVPFYHQNIDYDEVLFYHDGNFFSRDNLHAGMVSLHPAGFPHGPHPKAVKNAGGKTHTDEYAVMIDAVAPLNIESAFEKVEVKEYWQSWMK